MINPDELEEFDFSTNVDDPLKLLGPILARLSYFRTVTGDPNTSGKSFPEGGLILDRLNGALYQKQPGGPIVGAGGGGGGGDLLSTNNLSDVADPAVALANLGGLDAADVVSQAEAEDGTSTVARAWTAERVKQAVVALAPSGGGAAESLTFEMATDLADGVAEAGKLAVAEAGKVVVSERTPPVAGTADSWDITINSIGVVGTPSTQASVTLTFSGQPADADQISLQIGQQQYQFEFDNDMGVSPGYSGVQIGPTQDSTIQNLWNAILMNTMPDELQVELVPGGAPPFTGVKLIAGSNYPGTVGNSGDLQLQQLDSASITSDLPGTGFFQGGADGIPSSYFELQDFGEGPGSEIFAVIVAGVDWNPLLSVDNDAEALAVASAMETAFISGNMVNDYSTSVTNNVITLTRGVISPQAANLYSNNWSIPNDILFNQGNAEYPELWNGLSLGAIVSVAGGVATVNQSRIQEFIADSDIVAGQDVTGGVDGTVRYKEPGTEDFSFRVGVALVDALSGQQVLVKMLD